MMICESFIAEGHPVSIVLSVLGIPRSSYYYKPVIDPKQRGRSKSEFTKVKNGGFVSNAEVVEKIEIILGQEFVDYGYLKVTHWLRQNHNYEINPKKVYRLMQENSLLNKRKKKKPSKRQWVTELVPNPSQCFDYMEFDIKYMYVAGKRSNALLLSVIDVKSRWVLGQYIGWEIRKEHVMQLFDQLFSEYQLPSSFYVRNDNGSQFIASAIQKYFKDRNVDQEFCRPATPQQNAHIESYFSIVESVICQKYEFVDLNELQETMNRFIKFYNLERIHSGVGYVSPKNYLSQQKVLFDYDRLERTINSKSLENEEVTIDSSQVIATA